MIRVAALELPARWNDFRAALDDADALLARGPACDLTLLPEASLTGYLAPNGDADLRRFAEPVDGATTRALADLARAHRTCVAGPLIEADGARFYNALVVVDAEGRTIARYRKRHPWFPETWATPGDDAPPSFTIAGARFTACICFDVHFVVEEASDALRAADVLLFPSAWVEEHDDSRASMLASIARDFDVAIVNANWGPGVPRLPGQGASTIVSRDGREVARVESALGAARRIDAELR
jgi:predicted amidohydrolase